MKPLVACMAAVVLAGVAGCGADAGDERATAVLNVGRSDINAVEADDVDPGGELRWPYDRVPLTFNYHQVNGPEDETRAVLGAVLPRVFVTTADGRRRTDPDYVLAADMVSRVPQVVRYVINPSAVWSDGKPITWRDFEAQWQALNGTNPAYQTASTNGYDDIASVRRGADDREVLVTFEDKFAEWDGLFTPLYPAAHYGTPTAFNTGWLRALPATAGPFVLQSLDPLAERIVLARNDRWWGNPAKLDRIAFKPYDEQSYFQGLATNDLDYAPIGYDVNLARQVRTLPDFVIRQSVDRQYQELLFNGAPGTVLADIRVRQAVASGLDRAAIARRAIGEITPAIQPSGNHIYPPGHAAYRDNSEAVAFDPTRAGRRLDTLGWRRQGERRALNGRPLQLRLVVEAGDVVSETVGAAVVEQLAAIGIGVTQLPMTPEAKDQALRTGGFDLILDREQLNQMPLSREIRRHYEVVGADVGSNFGRISNPVVVDRFREAANEIDDLNRAADANGLDELLWSVVHSVPLFPSPGASAVRRSVVNFGSPGLADVDYTRIGFDS